MADWRDVELRGAALERVGICSAATTTSYPYALSPMTFGFGIGELRWSTH